MIEVSRGIKFSFTFAFLVKIISSSTLGKYVMFTHDILYLFRVSRVTNSDLFLKLLARLFKDDGNLSKQSFSRLERSTGNLRAVFTFSFLSSLQGLCWKHTTFFGWLMTLEP